MAIALVVNAIGSANTDPVTAAVDTTGATLLVIAVSWVSSQPAPTISDSKGNSWTKLTTRVSSDQSICIWYSVPTTVGSSHTVTATGTSILGTVYLEAFSGTHASTPYEAESAGGTSGGATSIQPGSLTPAENDEVLVCAVGLYDNTSGWSINSSFNITDSNSSSSFNPRGGLLAYKIQTTAGAENPTASWTGTSIVAATMATFKAAAAGGGFNAAPCGIIGAA